LFGGRGVGNGNRNESGSSGGAGNSSQSGGSGAAAAGARPLSSFRTLSQTKLFAPKAATSAPAVAVARFARFQVEFSGATLGLGLQPTSSSSSSSSAAAAAAAAVSGTNGGGGLSFFCLPVVNAVPLPGSAAALAMKVVRLENDDSDDDSDYGGYGHVPACSSLQSSQQQQQGRLAVAEGDVVECVAGVVLRERFSGHPDPYGQAIALIKASSRPLTMVFSRRLSPLDHG